MAQDGPGIPHNKGDVMGIYDREYYRGYEPPWYTFSGHRATKGIIAVNVAVFAVQLMTSFKVQGMGPFTDHMVMNPVKVFTDFELWRLITAAFLHDPYNPFHLIFNMLALWFFGRDVEELYGPREFLAFYLVGGILGNLAWGLTVGLMVPPQFLPFACALGASGAVSAVLVLAACHNPRQTVLVNFFIPMPLWAMVLLYIGLDAFYFMKGMSLGRAVTNVGVAAHLGGAAWGGLYYYFQLRLLGWWKGWRLPRPGRAKTKLKVFRPESADDEPFAPHVRASSREQEQLEAKMDAVLAKMAREGKEKLTPEELEILQRASEVFRKRKP